MLRAAIAAGVLAASGCGDGGPPLVDVSGRVVDAGGPVIGASVMMRPNSGRSSVGMTDEDGRFEMKFAGGRPGVLPGEHTLTVQLAASPTAATDAVEIGRAGMSTAKAQRFVLPQRVTVEVGEPLDTVDIDLRSFNPAR